MSQEMLFDAVAPAPAAVAGGMKITALAPWFGGKRTLSPIIVGEMGGHRTYWELFCGSMAVLLDKPSCSMETVNDLHGDLTNLARTIQHVTWGPWLYRKLRRVLLSQDMLRGSFETIKYDILKPAHERAFDFFIMSWFGRSGCVGTSSYNANFCVRYTNRGGSPSKRFASAVESIPAWRRRLRNVTILSEDGIKLAERIADDPGTVIYADPPYLVKGSKYKHDFTDADHARLAEVLRRFRNARVIVSYYAHPLLDSLYPGWTRRSVAMTKSLVSQGKRDADNKVEAPEVLLLNSASYAKEGA